MSRRASTIDWTEIPADPDLERDLGYHVDDWQVVKARKNGTGHLMFLPEDEAMLREDAFIVVDDSSVCDVADRV